MPMLPIFICGIILGVICGATCMDAIKCMSSSVKTRTLEDTIVNLKEDVALLEATNKDLLEELRRVKKTKQEVQNYEK